MGGVRKLIHEGKLNLHDILVIIEGQANLVKETLVFTGWGKGGGGKKKGTEGVGTWFRMAWYYLSEELELVFVTEGLSTSRDHLYRSTLPWEGEGGNGMLGAGKEEYIGIVRGWFPIRRGARKGRKVC